MGRAGLWKYEKVDGSFWHSIADRDGLGTRIQFTKYAKVWNVFVHFTVLLTTLIGVLSLQTSPPYNRGGGNPLSPVSTPHRGLLFGSGWQQESLAELNMGLSGPGQLELKSSSTCPMDSLFCVQSHTALILNPPSNICKAGVTCCWHTNAFPWEREGWLNWFWKPFCVGKNTCSLQTLHLGFLCLFSSYCFFWTKDQNAAVGWWLWEDALSFLVGFISQGMPDVVHIQIPRVKEDQGAACSSSSPWMKKAGSVHLMMFDIFSKW